MNCFSTRTSVSSSANVSAICIRNPVKRVCSDSDRASDTEIWEHAKREGFTIVSQDADFAELAAIRGHPPKVIWLRGRNQPTEATEVLLRQKALLISDFHADESLACLEIY